MEQRVELMGNALMNASTLASDLNHEREVDDCVTVSQPACFVIVTAAEHRGSRRRWPCLPLRCLASYLVDTRAAIVVRSVWLWRKAKDQQDRPLRGMVTPFS